MRPRPHAPAPAGRALRAALLGAALLGAPPAAAQAPEPFSRVEVGVARAVNVNRERLHERWDAAPGVQVRVATPFYLGSVAIGVQRTPFSPRQPDLPEFDATLVTAGWDLRGTLAGRVRASAGGLVGNVRFDFVEPGTGRTRDESELLVGARAGVDARLAGGLGLAAAAAHHRVLTRHPIDLTIVTVGLTYRVDAPEWLRGFLQ